MMVGCGKSSAARACFYRDTQRWAQWLEGMVLDTEEAEDLAVEPLLRYAHAIRDGR